MTRKHYIKKWRYLRWRLLQLPCNKGEKRKDWYWSDLQKIIPIPSQLGSPYDKMWAKVVKAMRTIEGLEDIE